MTSFYFDTVHGADKSPLFSGTPEQTVEWLNRKAMSPGWTVCRGRDMEHVSVDAYLAADRERRRAKTTEKQAMVEEIVLQAVSAQAKATYHSDDDGGMTILAQQAAEKIVRLFT
jgi:hypothetical protein